MGDTTRFGLEVNKKILKDFIDAVHKNYYNGKIRALIEEFMKKYVEKENNKEKNE